MSRRLEGEMSQTKTWHWLSLVVAFGLVTASAAVPAANGRTIQQGQRPPGITIIPGFHDHWLGLTLQDVNPAKARELKLPGDYGAIVVSVIPGSPAAKAGFQPNDVILEFASRRVMSVAQLQRLVEETPPDRTVKVEISRQGKLQTLEVKIENRGPNAFQNMPFNPNGRLWQWPFYLPPEGQPRGPFALPEPWPRMMPLPPATPFNSPFSPEENTLGISGDNLTPQLARFFGVKEGRGVLISRVVPGSPASAAGLKAGDVIVRVGSQEVGSMAELRWALQSQENKKHRVTLGIVRDRQEREMSVLLIPGLHGVKPEPIMSLRYK
jgi:serine protease Do